MVYVVINIIYIGSLLEVFGQIFNGGNKGIWSQFEVLSCLFVLLDTSTAMVIKFCGASNDYSQNGESENNLTLHLVLDSIILDNTSKWVQWYYCQFSIG